MILPRITLLLRLFVCVMGVIAFQFFLGNTSSSYRLDTIQQLTSLQGVGGSVYAQSVCTTDSSCNDGNLCTTDTCDSSGGCINTKRPVGTQCGATSFCNIAGACVNAQPVCTVGASCNDSNVCTTGDKYNANCQCVGTSSPAGTSCGAGKECNGGGACENIPSGPACTTDSTCNDNNLCTTDTCGSGGSCVNTKRPEGTQCGATSFCNAAGACVNTQPACTVGAACNDSYVCTTGDKYNANCQCVGTPSAAGTSCGAGKACDGDGTCEEIDSGGGFGECDQSFDFMIRYGSVQDFFDTFTNGGSCIAKILGGQVSSPSIPFSMVGEGLMVGPGQEVTIFQSSSVQVNIKGSFSIIYAVDYQHICSGVPLIPETHTECANYITTRCGDGVTQPFEEEECDDGPNNGKPGKCSTTCTLPEPPSCSSSFSGQVFRVTAGTVGTKVTQQTPGLCAVGLPVNVGYADGKYTWRCSIKATGASTEECSATETWCGDGTIDAGETCDDGAQNGQPGKCTLECKPPVILVCGDAGFDHTKDNNPATTCTPGANECPGPTVCSADQDIPDNDCNPYDPFADMPGIGCQYCDVATCKTVKKPVEYCGDGIKNGGELCDDGNENPFDACVTFSDEGVAVCRPPICGDGYVDSDGIDNTVGTSDDEQCDDGNTVDGDGCSAKCKLPQIPECSSSFNGQVFRVTAATVGTKVTQQTPGVCIVGLPVNVAYANGKYTWKCSIKATGVSTEECSANETWCGDGTKDTGEMCDPADTDNKEGRGTDGCTQECKAMSTPLCSSSFDGQVFRVTAGTVGTKVTQQTPGVCTVGLPVNVVYANGKYTWRCSIKATGASTEECTATETWCGDGTKDSGETCDRGDTDAKEGRGSANPGCSTLCEPLDKPLVCGDPGYDAGPNGCNFGDPNDGIPDSSCVADYQLTGGAATCEYCKPDCTKGQNTGPYCGDKNKDTSEGELCDDGNGVDTDECGNDCRPPVCGDGTKDAGEECNEPGLSCSSTEVCNTTTCECTPVAVQCGDGVRNNGEICDRADTDLKENRGSAGCSQQCTKINKEIICGDGIRTPRGEDGIEGTPDDEECNEPNAVCEIRDVCNPVSCQCEPKPMLCGNGIVDEDMGELCDDGNMVDGDGCSAMCFPENIICGDGVKHPMEECEIYGQPANQCGQNATCEYCECVPKTKKAECASMFDGAIIYDPDNKGDGLTARPQLCAVGNVSMFQYNPITHEWSWQCVGTGGTTDFCKATEQRCGDNVVQTEKGEQCDGSGSPSCGAGYTCSACGCVYAPVCGNGIVDAGEQCDDGKNGRNTDGCTDECKNTICGDGVVQKPNGSGVMERCDDGNTNNNDACTNACETGYCGDGVVWTGKEQCDDGNTIDTDGCSNACTISKQCGDGVKDPGEQCDDGNAIAGDGCNARCESEFCGDDYLDRNGADNLSGTVDDEQCEVNADCTSGKTCNSLCDCVGVEPKCGDGIKNPGEQCDDGNTIDTDGCSNTCTISKQCGDGVKDPGEQCDDGNTVAGDGCFACKIETQSTCIGLAVSDVQVTVPYSLGYLCLGTGSTYSVTLTANGQTVQQKNTKSGVFAIETPGSYQVSCFVDGVTSPECKHTVTAGGYCEELTVTTTGGQVPFTGSFTCDGIGSAYELLIVDDNNQVIKKVTDTKKIVYSHLFENPGTYSAQCFVDGLSNLTCDESGLQTIVVGGASGSGRSVSTSFPGGTGSLLNNAGGYKALDAFAQHRTDTLIQNFVRTINRQTVTRLQKGEVVVGSEVTALYKAIVVTESVIEAVCSNRCEVALVGNTTCGNGILEPEKGEECDDGNTVSGDKCSAYCEREGGDGKTSSITCGNGKLDKNEECDDGNVRDDDGCTRFCEWEDESSDCGDGTVDIGEECDDGSKNGNDSLCSASCTLKGFKPHPVGSVDEPKCSFIDPPAVQINGKESEYLPFRRALEDADGVVYGNDTCRSASDIGTIPADSMECHFSLQMSDGKTHNFVRPCMDDSLTSMSRFGDLQQDVGTIESTRGNAYLALKDIPISSYGEFSLSLEKVTYDICGKETKVSDDGQSAEVVYSLKRDQVYEKRVCQYNFPVTTPYFIQKGVSLSSSADDREKLSNFKKLDGRTILDVSGLKPLQGTSGPDSVEMFKAQAIEMAEKATEFVTANHPLGTLGVNVKKVSAQEIYVADEGFTLTQQGAAAFNGDKPTTIIVRGNATVRIEGSLQGNILLLVPDGTVVFVNADCDSNDTVHGIVVANTVSTDTKNNLPLSNSTTTSYERCMGGGLTVQGVVIGLTDEGLISLKQDRRSTLQRWFEESESLEEKIFNGAAVRVEANTSLWNNLPPLADAVLKAVSITRQ